MEVELRLLRYFLAVAAEQHVGRAAARLHMTQPPLSRALRALEDELGAELLVRTPRGVLLTAAGEELRRRATSVLAGVDRIRDAVQATAGVVTLTIGTLGDTADHLDARLTAAFRRTHPHAELRVREYDLSDPSAGLRSAGSDVAVTRLPFDTRGLRTARLGREPVGVVVRREDPLAAASTTRLADLSGRHWVRLPPDADAVWLDYWTGGPSPADEPVTRTIQECVQSVLWNDRVALAPVSQRLPDELTVVPVQDRPASELALAWDPRRTSPALRAFLDAVHTARLRPATRRDVSDL